MLHRAIPIILLSLLLPGSVFATEWVSLSPAAAAYAPPTVTVLADDPSGTTLRVDLAGFAVETILSGGTTYHAIDLLTETATAEPGSPEVPYLARLLAVPDRGGITAEVIALENVQKFHGYLLPPARPSWREGDAPPPLLAAEAAYASVAVIPDRSVRVDDPVIFRDFRVARVAIAPVRYSPAARELEVAASVTVRLSYGPGPAVNAREPRKRLIAPSFGAIYRSVLVNYQSVLEREYGGVESGRDVLLCIVPDTFATSFRPYAEWKHKTGVFTVVTKFSQIGATATNATIIRNYIATTYTGWADPPTHILLVGDYGKVPRKQIQYDYTFANEDYFVELEGDDYFPEMMIGRFTHDTDYRLQILVSKAIRYEQSPYLTNDTWFRRGIVCSNDNYESQITTKRFTAEVMMLDGGFLSVDTMMSKTPCLYDKADVINAVSAGRSFLNYRGEGWTDGWWAACTPLRSSDIPSINNGQMLTFVTSIGCGVAMFDASSTGNCFGEEWLELGTPTAPRGAVAFVGPTSNTHTTYNNKIDKGIYVGMFSEGMDTPGQALLRGKLYMYNVYGNEHWVEYHYRVYCVLGDPSVHIWKTTPRRAAISYPGTIAIGFNQVTVEVQDSLTHAPVAGATVCLTGDSIFVVAATDSNGRALIPVDASAVDTLALVVRGPAVAPAQGTVRIIPDVQHVSPLGNPLVTDLDGNMDGRVNPNEHINVSVTLKNWGTGTASAVTATLASEDTALADVVNAGPIAYGTLASGDSAAGTPFQIYVKPACPVGTLVEFLLQVASTDRSWEYLVQLDVKGCRLTYVGSLINDQGGVVANSRLDPGETVLVTAVIQNAGEDGAPGVVGVLRSADPFITIQDSVGSFGAVAAGASAANTADFFIVSVSDSCPGNYSAPFILELRTQGGRYPYVTLQTLSIPVGMPLPSDPTGPDGGGYYAYSSDDTLYEQAPVFDWFDIGTLGTLIPRNSNGDFTQTVTLPFSFRYYGNLFTQVRISSDGWIAFGSGTQTSYTNHPLPYADNVNNMVAAFWDDLFRPSSDTLEHGRLLHYYDAGRHRFIAQWDSVGHYSSAANRETFQIILLDPAYYPTASGNGEIILQYHTVNEDGSMTAGTENGTQDVGMLYVYNDTYDSTANTLKNGFAVKFTTERPTFPSTAVSIDVGLAAGWNMISNPVALPESLCAVRTLFPTSAFDYVFAFSPAAGYTQQPSMSCGPGYWGKFPQSGVQTITGTAVARDTLDVGAGWNMIGSISALVDTAALVTIPPGLTNSLIYGYSGGYAPARYMIPGEGYWVKCSAAGRMILAPGAGAPAGIPAPPEGSGPLPNSLTVRDARGGKVTLYFGTGRESGRYAMPPLPPREAFDIRFETADGGSLVQTHPADVTSAQEWPIAVQASAYPLTVSWEITGGHTYELDGGIVLSGSGSRRIEGTNIRRLVLRLPGSEGLPSEFALLQNYPNPFNPETSIRFALPVRSTVTGEVFNLVGQRVRVLLQEIRAAGFHTIRWDATGDGGQRLGSGVYFLRLEARGENGASFTAVQKLVFMK